MNASVPAEISGQLARARAIIERHLASTLVAVHLYGSALDGGLKPFSDIDLLVTTTAPLAAAVRQALVSDLLKISAPPGASRIFRALEVTVIVYDDIVPWRYPPRRELQFGEWQREDILADAIEPAVIDPDLAVLLTKARQKSVALLGPAVASLFDPVPESDFRRVLSDTVDLWNSPPDWSGDERHVVLTLARIWYSAATGKIAPKDVAADWAIERLPAEHEPVLLEARQAYLGDGEDRLASREEQVSRFVSFAKGAIARLLDAAPSAADECKIHR